MALRFVDGFDSYTATSDLTKKWGVAGSPWAYGAAFGRTGGGGIQAATTGGGIMRFKDPLVAFNAVFALAFWIKVSAAPSALSTLINVGDGTLSAFTIRINTSGQLALYNVSSALVAAGTANICDNAWHWVEIRTAASNTTNAQQCHVDTTQQWSNTSTTNTAGTNAYCADFTSITGITVSLDDIIAYDSTGTDLTPGSNYPIGIKQISTLRPNGDDSVQFTRSTGATNASCVDEQTPDTTDYVEDGTSGHQDLYTYTDLGFTPASVTAVAVSGYIQNPNPGTINFQQSCKSNTTTSQGTSTVAPPGVRIMQEFFYKDPNGNIAWTGAAVDAAKFGIKVV